MTLQGMFGVLRPGSTWAPAPPPAPGSTVVDGVFRPEGTTWTDQTVWWDAMVQGSENNAIIIDFGSVFDISSVRLQADDNDNYWIDYRVGASDPWTSLGYFGTAGSYGMVTRGPAPVSFAASQVRLRGADGDSYYAISEFQAITVTPRAGLAGAPCHRVRGPRCGRAPSAQCERCERDVSSRGRMKRLA